MNGREIAGLPVFSWQEGAFLGRVEQCYLDIPCSRLGGVMMEKAGFRRTRSYISAKEILKIYRDGIIVKTKSSIELKKNLPKGKILYSTFLQNIDMPFSEGEIISDLFFDDKNRIAGGEISGGFWKDVSHGRGFCPWVDLKNHIRIQKNGR